MTHGNRRKQGKGGVGVLTTVASLLLILGGLTGCDDLLEVELPGVVDESALEDPAISGLLVNSAVADFECAYNNYTFGSSAFSDEMWHSSGAQIDREWGGRIIDANHQNMAQAPCQGTGFGQYTPIQTARTEAEDAVRRITEFPDADVPNKASLIATAHAYAGYNYVMLGEAFCEMAIDGGSLLTPDQVLRMAEEHFTQALSGGTAEIVNMARVGRARVRLDLGDGPGAVSDAQAVPEGFMKVASRGDDHPRRYNKGYDRYTRATAFTVSPRFRDLEWKGVADPRVAVEFTSVLPTAPPLDHFKQTKYTSLGTPIPLATWEEAQLIIAEVSGGQTAVDIINALHARAGLPSFDPATDGDILAQVLQERSRELFLEGGHRLNDHLRYMGTAHEIPFFTGVDHLGRQYGNATCWPLPNVERHGNPNIP
ncbi:MAG: RagB/SusD family nutrient uptake outer membrane protein [Gemmatimonadota bacterium]|nr:RagB/SusD family nutrient uptake outer membrane protein [Gemmatimonadota bacterium]